MKFHISTLSIVLLAAESSLAFTTPFAFTTPSVFSAPSAQGVFGRIQGAQTPLYAQQTPEEQVQADQEIERLLSMAQKLRAEASALEANRAEDLAKAAESAFRKFDTNQDGKISLTELKAGLEKILKTELPEERVRKVMEDFDVSGGGTLELDEFVGVDQFRNKLEALAREEKQQSREAAKSAQDEAETAKLAESRLLILNDKEPTVQDKLISVLPYLFPLMDSLQFGRFLFTDNQDNPVVIALALLYSVYRAIPFSGFVAFLALNSLTNNPSINRLVRFNMQQAIFLDIALFFPGLLAALSTLVFSGAGASISPVVTQISSDVVFGGLVLAIVYCSASSLLGIPPNKIPFISQLVEDRTLSLDMFDADGQFVPRQMREEKDDKKDKD
jgi:hypothetical protein